MIGEPSGQGVVSPLRSFRFLSVEKGRLRESWPPTGAMVTVAPTDQESTLESAPVVSGGRRPRGEAAFRVAGTATRQSVPLPPDCLPRRGFPDSGMRS